MTQPTEIVWTNNLLVLKNPSAEMLKQLQYSRRQLDPTNPKGAKYEKFLLYNELERDSNTFVTHHGFLDSIQKIAKKHKQPIKLTDKRLPMPAPRFDLMVRGLRGVQAQVVAELLLPNKSGILNVPTRWGKFYAMVAVLRAFPKTPAIVAIPGIDLVQQTVDKLKEILPSRNVAAIASNLGKTEGDDITVVSFDSLDKVDRTNCKLLLVDEVHAAVSESRAPMFADFENARMYGFSATVKGRYDGADKLIVGLFGPVLAQRTFTQSVADGMVCPIRVYMIKVPPDQTRAYSYTQAMGKMFFNNQVFYDVIANLCNNVLPSDWQTLVFIRTKKQAARLTGMIEKAEEAVAANMTATIRKELFRKMQANEVSRCVATSVYAQGVTFSDLRVMINFSGGGGNVFTIQKPGRLAEVRDGKECGYMFDFYFPADERWADNDNRMKYCREANTRVNTYQSMGYEVVFIEPDELETLKLK